MKAIHSTMAAAALALMTASALAATPAPAPASAPAVMGAGDCDKGRRDEPPEPKCEERKKRCAWLKPCPKPRPPAARTDL